ncbi:MAG: NAD-binding protein [Chloroflexota bacterium]
MEAQANHIVLCGLDGLGFRTLEELLKLGESVVVVVEDGIVGFGARAEALGAKLVQGNYREEATLCQAGIQQASALVITEANDVGNIHAALAAQELNPNLRIVLRIFNQDFGGRLEALFQDCAVLSSSSIAAPAFVTAALRQTSEQQVVLAGKMLQVRIASSSDPGVLLPLAHVQPDGSAELFPTQGDQLICLTDTSAGLSSQGVSRAARKAKQPGAWTYARAVARSVDSRLLYALLFLLGLSVVSMLILFAFNPDPVDAFYNTVTIIVSGGLGDLDPAAIPLSLKVFGTALMLIGATLLTVFYALITDAIVSVRLDRALGRLQVSMKDHIVVCGLGNIGYRVATQLHALGIQVAATEKDETGRGIPEVRRLGVPVLIADARQPETLRALNVAEARCIVIATDDDAANLETALNARAINPGLRVVLRLFDHDLADKVERAFSIHISRSVSSLAAPSFATAALGHTVAATIPAGSRVLIVAQTTIEGTAWADSRTVGEMESACEGKVVLVEHAGQGQTWRPAPSQVLSAGDKLGVVVTRKGLVEAIRISSM